jgi:hypothetical protein
MRQGSFGCPVFCVKKERIIMARTTQTMTHRESLTQKAKAGRSNLLLAIILTLVNIVMLVAGGDSMLLFSISVPYYAVIFGVILGGQELMITGCVIAGIILLAYFLCWLFSKKHAGWLVAALVMMIVDTLALIGFYLLAQEISGILDLLFHALIIYYIAAGISSSKKLAALPPEVPVVMDPQIPVANSVPLRRIDEDEKCRILLENTYGTYRLVYRRVKSVNQLVINNYVYDEVQYVIEPAHTLTAILDGHKFEVGYDGRNYSYFLVDGNEVEKKMRLV